MMAESGMGPRAPIRPDEIELGGSNMQVTEQVQDGVRIVRPEGRLDTTTAPDFEKQLIAGLEAQVIPLVLDFSALDYISSAGLRVVLMASKQMKARNSKMALCALNRNVREVFDISGFLQILQVYDSLDQARGEVTG